MTIAGILRITYIWGIQTAGKLRLEFVGGTHLGGEIKFVHPRGSCSVLWLKFVYHVDVIPCRDRVTVWSHSPMHVEPLRTQGKQRQRNLRNRNNTHLSSLDGNISRYFTALFHPHRQVNLVSMLNFMSVLVDEPNFHPRFD